MQRSDLVGKVFNGWTVLGYSHTSEAGKSVWDCLCKCGRHEKVQGNSLLSGTSRNCGCDRLEKHRSGNTTHGLSRTPEHKAWCSARKRCNCPTNHAWARYGGRGIKVCDRWGDFLNFLDDMGPRPAGASLDRINNDGNYEPGNCRWATPYEQNGNRSNTVNITAFGQSRNIASWARCLWMTHAQLSDKLKAGKTVEDLMWSRVC